MDTEGNILRIEIKKSGMRQEDFASEMGFSRNYLLRLMERAKLPDDIKAKCAKLLKKSVHEIFGVHNANNVSEPIAEYKKGNASFIDLGDRTVINVPLVGQLAYAGYLNGFADEEYVETLPTTAFVVDKEPKGKYIAFEVRGDSMDDGTSESYISGDVLLCREIKRDLWQSKLHIKKWDFVIVHRTKGIVIKKIKSHDTATGLHPQNFSPIHKRERSVPMEAAVKACEVFECSYSFMFGNLGEMFGKDDVMRKVLDLTERVEYLEHTIGKINKLDKSDGKNSGKK